MNHLEQALRRLSQSLPRDASPATEQRVLAAFRARRKRPLSLYAAALAASLALATAWFLSNPHSHPAPRTLPDPSGFIALPYAQSDVPLEQAVIVRVTLASSDWRALGLPAAPLKTTTPISADLLIGQDGVARAVRLVQTQSLR